MIANPTERRIGVKNTKAFIDASPTEVELRRPRKEVTEAGGSRKVTPDFLPSQAFRIVPMSGLVWDRSRSTPDEGRIDDVTMQLIGMPDADVRKNDYFPAPDGGFYLVTHVSPLTGYRREARLKFTDDEPKS